MVPSPVQIGTGYQIFLAYHGETNQHEYTTFTGDITDPDAWDSVFQMAPDFDSASAPDVTVDQVNHLLVMVFSALASQEVDITYSAIGQNGWVEPEGTGARAADTPSVDIRPTNELERAFGIQTGQVAGLVANLDAESGGLNNRIDYNWTAWDPVLDGPQ